MKKSQRCHRASGFTALIVLVGIAGTCTKSQESVGSKCRPHIRAASDTQQPSDAVKVAASRCWAYATGQIVKGLNNPMRDEKAKKIVDWERRDFADEHGWSVAVQTEERYEADCTVPDKGDIDPRDFQWIHPLPDCLK